MTKWYVEMLIWYGTFTIQVWQADQYTARLVTNCTVVLQLPALTMTSVSLGLITSGC